MNQSEGFLTDIRWRFILNYWRKEKSLFRHYQDMFLERHGPKVEGRVIEIGAEPHYHHQRFFPNADPYLTSNISDVRGSVDLIVDVTDMAGIPSDSLDGLVCVSVLEHVSRPERAFAEIRRALRSGGMVILTVPFAFPYHDEIDYWRMTGDCFRAHLPGSECDILCIEHFGGTFSSIANVLQRPRGRLSKRFLAHKSLGLLLALAGKVLDTHDGFPLGYGVVAKKK